MGSLCVQDEIGMGIGTLGTGDTSKENKRDTGTNLIIIDIIASTNNHITLAIAIKIPG